MLDDLLEQLSAELAARNIYNSEIERDRLRRATKAARAAAALIANSKTAQTRFELAQALALSTQLERRRAVAHLGYALRDKPRRELEQLRRRIREVIAMQLKESGDAIDRLGLRSIIYALARGNQRDQEQARGQALALWAGFADNVTARALALKLATQETVCE